MGPERERVGSNGSTMKHYNGRTTLFVVVTCIVAASGGVIFGYDVGISGGVTSMEIFLKKFFPDVLAKKGLQKDEKNMYCRFDNEILTTFTSSLYVAGLIASFFASITTRKLGRKMSILIGGTSFLLGATLNGVARNLEMLITGRIFLGIGVGFTNQSVPIYLSEMAPANMRGALNNMFQLAVTIGILCAQLVNFGTNNIDNDWGWRLSLGLAIVPAMIITVGSMFLPDTPNSLIERGHQSEGRAILVKIRGMDDVQEEFDDLVHASKVSMEVKHPWHKILQRQYRPQLVMAILIPFFQQLTGINTIMFYAPIIFRTIGFVNGRSLYSVVIIGSVNVLATVVSIALVDRYGRKFLFLEAGIQMSIAHITIGTILGLTLGMQGKPNIDTGVAVFVLVMICVYVAAFAWSWGPLGWLVPSEIFPLEIRPAGQSINVSVNFFFTFVVAQTFLSMLCNFKFAVFYFFAGWVLLMTIFVYKFFPETKNTPMEDMVQVWRNHPYWGCFIPPIEVEDDVASHTQI